MKKLFFCLLVLTTLLMLSACGGDGAKTNEVVPKKTTYSFDSPDFTEDPSIYLGSECTIRRFEQTKKETNILGYPIYEYAVEIEVSIFPTKKAEYDNASIDGYIWMYKFYSFETPQDSDFRDEKKYKREDSAFRYYHFRTKLDNSGYGKKTIKLTIKSEMSEMKESKIYCSPIPYVTGNGYYQGTVTIEDQP